MRHFMSLEEASLSPIDLKKGNRPFSVPMQCSDLTLGFERSALNADLPLDRAPPAVHLNGGTIVALAVNAESPRNIDVWKRSLMAWHLTCSFSTHGCHGRFQANPCDDAMCALDHRTRSALPQHRIASLTDEFLHGPTTWNSVEATSHQ